MHYGYWILFPLTIVEGPIVTIVAAFLASLGYLNVYVVFLVALLGDVVGDTLYYLMGRHWGDRAVRTYGHRIGITEARIDQVRVTFFTHHQSLWRIIGVSKLTQAPSAIALLLSGMMQVSYRRFLVVTSVTSAAKVLVLVLLGYFFGASHTIFASYVSHAWMFLIPTIAVLVYVFYLRHDHGAQGTDCAGECGTLEG